MNELNKIGRYEPDKHGDMIPQQAGNWLHIEEVINLIESHSGWHKYPDEKPELNDYYFCAIKLQGNYYIIPMFYSSDGWTDPAQLTRPPDIELYWYDRPELPKELE